MSATARAAAILGGLCGVGLGVLGAYLLVRGTALPPALPVSLILVGLIELACARATLARARVGWAFGLAIGGTAATIFLFGAPKLRDAAAVPIAVALLPALIFGVVALLHALSADEY
jgi:hypothetical protein